MDRPTGTIAAAAEFWTDGVRGFDIHGRAVYSLRLETPAQ